ncbi:MAG: class I SAM-dependent methyltransferase [Candidatus Micrarchaeia archaeon]
MGKEHDYYSKGDERFGYLSSKAYSFFSKMPISARFYDFVVSDIMQFKGKGISALDVGAGNGVVPIRLRKEGILKEVYAVEPSEHMRSIFMNNVKRERIKAIHVGPGSSTHIPFKRKFDLIYSTLSFHHWSKKVESLAYLSNFLKSGGEIRIYEVFEGKKKGVLGTLAMGHSLSRETLTYAANKANLRVKSIRVSKGLVAAVLVRGKDQV